MYFITIKRMLEVCFSAHPNIQYRAIKIRQRQTADERKQVADAAVFCFSCTEGEKKDIIENHIEKPEN